MKSNMYVFVCVFVSICVGLCVRLWPFLCAGVCDGPVSSLYILLCGVYKCNYLSFNPSVCPFPYADVSMCLIFICTSDLCDGLSISFSVLVRVYKAKPDLNVFHAKDNQLHVLYHINHKILKCPKTTRLINLI